MPKHAGYFTDSIQSQPWYRCVQCPYDCFSADGIAQHIRQHPQVVLPEADIPIEAWVEAHRGSGLAAKRIGLGLLTWNTIRASTHAMMALVREAHRLRGLGIESVVIWADNGSTDGTQALLPGFLAKIPHVQVKNAENLGQCPARNQIQGAALELGCDYLLMVDGDIEIVPFSAFALARFLEGATDQAIGCVGLYCRNCTAEADSGLARECRCIEPWMVDSYPPIAWTNYGMFRREVLESCKFEESGPFSGPGWGFEDDDYYMQMTVAGWKSVNTKYFRHLHRHRHSSVGLLGRDLAAKVHGQRKAFLLEKWRGVEQVAQHIRVLGNQSMPVV